MLTIAQLSHKLAAVSFRKRGNRQMKHGHIALAILAALSLSLAGRAHAFSANSYERVMR
jgi:hypothetical protein